MQKSKSLNPIRFKIQFQLEFNFAPHILSNFLIFVASESYIYLYIYIYIERERERERHTQTHTHTHTHTHKYLFTYNISCEYLFQSVFTNNACEIMYIAC